MNKILTILTLTVALAACGGNGATGGAGQGASQGGGGRGGRGGGRGGPNANMPVPVAVSSVRRAAVPYNIGANGTVYPIQTAAVASQVDGIVRRVAFKEGQDVQQGQLLFEIDPIPYRAAYNQALANLERDKATLLNAQKEVERYDDLVQRDYVTKEQADQIRANAGVAQASVASDSAAVSNAKFNLDNSTVRAPISGRTGQLLVRAGNLVHAASSTPLVVINQIKPIYVQFAIPATNLPDIQKYSSTGTLPVTVSPTTSAQPPAANDQETDQPPGTSISPGDPAPAQQPSSQQQGQQGQGQSSQSAGGPPSQPAVTSQPRAKGANGAPVNAQGPVTVNVPQTTGTLSFVNNAVDTITGTVLLKGTFSNARGELWPGEYVATTLRLYVQQDALVVPQAAVMTGQQGSYVFVIDAKNTAQQRSIVVSRMADTLAVISRGLTEGEKVVTDGQSRLTQGAKVNVRGLQTTASSGSLP